MLHTKESSVGKRKKRIVITGILVLVLLVLLLFIVVFVWDFGCGPLIPMLRVHNDVQPEGNLGSAVNYLKSHFDSNVGLVYESEDAGTRTIGGQTYRYNQIFWLYSDNLLASWALKPYDAKLSCRINETIHSYTNQSSGFFEVLFGYPVSEDMRGANQLVVSQNSGWVVMAEFHNSSSTRLSWRIYGDTLIYQSLNEYLKGNRIAANQYFEEAYRMFDGKGVNDLATKTDGKYATYKLALLLYAAKILNYPTLSGENNQSYKDIENRLWSLQQQNGGITSLSDLNGKPVGSANTETTAITLLQYNNELIARMHSTFGTYQQK